MMTHSCSRSQTPLGLVLLLGLQPMIVLSQSPACNQCTINYNSCILSSSTNPGSCFTAQTTCFSVNGCGTTSGGGAGSSSSNDAFLQECNESVGRAVRNSDNELDFFEFLNHVEEWAQMRCSATLNAPGAKSLYDVFTTKELQALYVKMACDMCTGFFDQTSGVDGSKESCGCVDSFNVLTVEPINFDTSTPTEVSFYCRFTFVVVKEYCDQTRTPGSSFAESSGCCSIGGPAAIAVWILISLTLGILQLQI